MGRSSNRASQEPVASLKLCPGDGQSVRNEAIEALRNDMVRILRHARIAFSNVVSNADGVQVRLRNAGEVGRVRSAPRQLVQPIRG